MSFREFYAAFYSKFPPDEKGVFESTQPFFDDEEKQILRDMESMVIH
jgi:hypothetical protein